MRAESSRGGVEDAPKRGATLHAGGGLRVVLRDAASWRWDLGGRVLGAALRQSIRLDDAHPWKAPVVTLSATLPLAMVGMGTRPGMGASTSGMVRHFDRAE